MSVSLDGLESIALRHPRIFSQWRWLPSVFLVSPEYANQRYLYLKDAWHVEAGGKTCERPKTPTRHRIDDV